MLFVIKSSFLILSPVFFSLFFLRDCQSFQMRDANFLSRVILVVVSSFEAFWNSSWSTFTHSKLPKNITTCHLQRVLEYGLPYKGLFTFCRWMITNLLHNSRCHSTVAKQDLHLPTSSLLIQPSTPAMNFVIFDMLPTSRFRRLLSLYDRYFIFMFNCQRICCFSRRCHLNPPCLTTKSRSLNLLKKILLWTFNRSVCGWESRS